METEIWKNVLGYEQSYEVSNFGVIRTKARSIIIIGKGNGERPHNIKQKIKKERIAINGYVTVALVKDSVSYNTYVHRIIAQSFIPNPNNYRCVNHKNGIKTDNRIENLEWCDHSYNNLHALDNNLRTTRKNMTKHFINEVLSLKQVGLTNEKIAIQLNSSEARVHGIVSGATYKRMR